jgi:hypothetical protein
VKNHYNHTYDTIGNMLRGTEFDWEKTNDEILEMDFICGFCASNITSKSGFRGWKIDKFRTQKQNQDIYICHKCSKPNFFDEEGDQHPEPRIRKNNFSEKVSSISSRFIKIYQQAQQAEEEELDEIAGPGYGKSLEVLVKDYLIKKIPDEEATIKALSLYQAIEQKVENPKIKALAKKATIVRNDETHYEKKYEKSDIGDLKNLINATAAWIDLESYTSEVEAE